MKQLIIDCATGKLSEIELTSAEIEANQKRRDAEVDKEKSSQAKRDAVMARVLSDSKLRDIAILLGLTTD